MNVLAGISGMYISKVPSMPKATGSFLAKGRSPNLVSKTPTDQPYSSSSSYNPCMFSGSPSFPSKFVHLKLSKQNKSCSFVGSGVSRRYCYALRNPFNHFIPRDYGRWFHNPKAALIVMLVGFGVVTAFFFGRIVVVPYNKRNQFRIVFNILDRYCESRLLKILEALKWKILPAEHPDSVRVRLIGNDIIAALQQGLRNEQDALLGDSTLKIVRDWRKATIHYLDGLNWEFLVVDDPNAINAAYLPGGKIFVYSGVLNKCQTDPEIATVICHEVGHAVALHYHIIAWDTLWYIIIQIVLYLLFMPYIVKSTIGIVAIYALLLRRPLWQKKELEADDTALMLRVWDVLLRYWRIIVSIAILFFMPHTLKAAIHIVGASAIYFLLSRPISRKKELEADYIGLMLMASAGYDPRVAPNVIKKIGEANWEKVGLNVKGIDNEDVKLFVEFLDEVAGIIGTHPSAKKRVKLLTEAMEDALSLYRFKSSH